MKTEQIFIANLFDTIEIRVDTKEALILDYRGEIIGEFDIDNKFNKQLKEAINELLELQKALASRQ